MNLLHLSKVDPNRSCDEFFEDTEWKLIYCIATKSAIPPSKPCTVGEIVMYLSWLGGPKRSPSACLPGIKTIWKGLTKFWIVFEHMESVNRCYNNIKSQF